ncbi:hypothetical protein Tco_0759368 [Tanacetum coccineum]
MCLLRESRDSPLDRIEKQLFETGVLRYRDHVNGVFRYRKIPFKPLFILIDSIHAESTKVLVVLWFGSTLAHVTRKDLTQHENSLIHSLNIGLKLSCSSTVVGHCGPGSELSDLTPFEASSKLT